LALPLAAVLSLCDVVTLSGIVCQPESVLAQQMIVIPGIAPVLSR